MTKVFVISPNGESVLPPIAWTALGAVVAATAMVLNHMFLGAIWPIDYVLMLLATVTAVVPCWRFYSRSPVRPFETELSSEHIASAIRSYERHLAKAALPKQPTVKMPPKEEVDTAHLTAQIRAAQEGAINA